MPQLKFHGATLGEKVIAEFYPINSRHRDFAYFLFQHVKNTSGNYYLKVYAIKNNGDLIKEVTVLKDNPAVPIDFTIWLPTDIEIEVKLQLDKLKIPPGQKIKSLQLIPKKYKKNYVGYKVKIKVAQTLVDFDEEINPSPPATREENEWEN